MSNLASRPDYEQEWTRRKALQLAILWHLTKRGSARLNRLYNRFNSHGLQETGEALQHLAHWRQIKVEANGTTNITESGKDRLSAGLQRPY
jgi:hypothetical protein